MYNAENDVVKIDVGMCHMTNNLSMSGFVCTTFVCQLSNSNPVSQ